jgi:NitT/TauT family transport system substrate-binding protein
MMTRGTLSVLIAAALSGVTACGSDTAAPDHVRVVVLPYLSQTVLHLADARGFFTEQNLEVEFVRMGRKQEVMASLARGQVDVTVGMLTANELGLAAQGHPLRVVASIAELPPEGCAYAAIAVRRELVDSNALRGPEQIRSLKFDVPALTPLAHWVDTAMRPLGLTVDDLDTADLPSPAVLAAMLAGSVDVTVDSQPWIDRLLSSDEVAVWFSVGSLLPHYPISLLVFGSDLLGSRREVGVRFLTAVLKASELFRRGKTPGNLDIVEAVTGLPREQLERTCWPTVPEGLRVGLSGLRAYERWSVERGAVDRVLRDEELFDFQLLETARGRMPLTETR